MKILLLSDRLGYGGAETHVVTLAAELKKAGHIPIVASSGGELELALARRKIRHIRLPLDKKDPLSVLIDRAAIDTLLSSGKFDVVHSHARNPSFIVSPLAKKHSLPLVCTAHARFSLTPLRKKLSRWGDSTIAVSEDLKQYLTEGYSLALENITVIPNPLDLSLFPERKEPSGIPTVVFLSRLDRDCSAGALLLCRIAERLCSRFGKIKIKIGGSGECSQTIRELSKKVNTRLGFECISLVGKVSDLPEFLSDASVFVGVSRAAMEAAVSEIPVVICGNEGFGGVLTEENFTSLSLENFCARGRGAASEKKLFEALCSILDGSVDTWAVGSLMRGYADSRECARKTLEVYSSCPKRGGNERAELLLCGYYGFSNMGDDALLRSAIKRARERFPALSVAALTKNGARDRTRFGVRCIKRSSPLSLLGALADCRYLVFGGGTLLQDGTSLRSLIYYCALLIAAKKFGARCLIWSNGIGPLSSRLSKALTARALECCDEASFRDPSSMNMAKKLAENLKTYRENDLAEAIAPADEHRAELILKSVFGEKIPRFIIAAPKGAEGVGDMLKALVKARRAGIAVLLVAMHEKEDGAITKKLAKLCGGKTAKGIGYSDLLALAKRSEGIYSMRLHALIAAKSVGAKYKAFGNDRKLRITL